MEGWMDGEMDGWMDGGISSLLQRHSDTWHGAPVPQLSLCCSVICQTAGPGFNLKAEGEGGEMERKRDGGMERRREGMSERERKRERDGQ